MKLKTEISYIKAVSLANGHIRLEPVYRAKPIEPGATPVGVMTRLAIAKEIERLLNRGLV